jgi:hypothetical protein
MISRAVQAVKSQPHRVMVCVVVSCFVVYYHCVAYTSGAINENLFDDAEIPSDEEDDDDDDDEKENEEYGNGSFIIIIISNESYFMLCR